MSAVLAVVVWRWCPLATFALVVYTGTELVKYKLGFQFALTADRETIRPSVPFANEMYYVLWLPMAAAVQVGYAQPALLWIPVLHALVFYQPIAQQVADWRAIGQNAGPLFRGFRRSM